jgi:hypothetical protein
LKNRSVGNDSPRATDDKIASSIAMFVAPSVASVISNRHFAKGYSLIAYRVRHIAYRVA